MSHWSTIKEKSCGYWPMLLLLNIYKNLGKTALKICLYPIVFIFYIASRQTRIHSKEYLNRIKIIRNEYNMEEVGNTTNVNTFNHIFSFADALTDRIISWSGELSLDIIKVQTKNTYNNFFSELENGKGAFLICSHLGNIEIFRALAQVNENKILKRKMRVNALMQIEHTENFNKLVKNINPNVTTNIISAIDVGVDTVIELQNKLDDGEIIVTSGDRTAAKNQNNNMAINFLGDIAYFPKGSFILASILKYPIYFVFIMKKIDGSYGLYMYENDIDLNKSRKSRDIQIEKCMESYSSFMESLALKYPHQWYNFFDFWKK